MISKRHALAAMGAWAAIGAIAPRASAAPAVSPADQALAFLTDYFRAEQKPPQRRTRAFEDWMTSRLAGLYRRAEQKSRGSDSPFLEADPVLNAQDADRPGDIRIERTGGTPERPEITVSFRVFAGDQARTRQILVFAEDRGEWRLYDIVTPAEGDVPRGSLRASAERYLRGR